MRTIEMTMPRMGESVMEGTILRWLKNVGDIVQQDESVLEVATDKVDTDIPAPFSGILEKILVQPGDVVPVGKPIAILRILESETNNGSSVSFQEKSVQPLPNNITESLKSSSFSSNEERFYSPLVRNIAQQENISLQELATIPGTGKDGRVTKKDILEYIEQRQSKRTEEPISESSFQKPIATPNILQTSSLSGESDIIEMDRMRKIIAQRMIESKNTSVHVTTFIESDVTNLVKWKNAMMRTFHEREGAALTYTPVFIQAVVQALKEFPEINISVEGEKIIRHKKIHVGCAVALPDGNTIVPVIKNADKLSLSGLVLAVNDLAKRARAGKLQPDELQGGTYTISNIGTFGNMLGTPIIVQPQVAIMSFGAIKKKPAVIETPQGDFIGIRYLMFISHSYDHRVIDGALGGMFLKKVSDILEKFDVNTPL
ncbi:MAG: 2-oxo acid dehydrogenase subunit E2 [Cytophagales bacterium]|nr:2-oxo acid dehydrogenase subunit E2 [Cytophagales bacterium]MDW8384786.1 dihydrolipoamide acetyltransferase family protein [Flammeovirgaceae bacterium]